VRIKKYYSDNFDWTPAKETSNFLDYQFDSTALGIKLGNKEREVGGNQTVIFEVEDINNLYKKVQDNNLNIYKELIKQEWGTSFAVLDVDGNKVEFSQKILDNR
jgi:predicted enzyme related to lactoylglutathione lyase